MVLLGRHTTIFEEVTKYTLKLYDNDWMLKLIRSSLEKMTVCFLEKFISLWNKLHLDVLLLYLHRLVRHSFLRLDFNHLVALI